MRYSFEIEFNKIDLDTPLVCFSNIYINNICIIAKNDKFGNFYFSKYIVKRKGNFRNVCGSHNHPLLHPVGNCVTLYIKNFPEYPIINNPYKRTLGESGKQYYSHIMIKNIKEYGDC